MLAFALMSGTAYPCTIHGFPAERLIETIKTGFLSEGFKAQSDTLGRHSSLQEGQPPRSLFDNH